LMGPSGCGKSTLINSIMGYNKDYGDTTGNLYLNGVAIQNLSKIKNYVGYVTQHDIMHENLTVKEILTYQAQLKLPEEDKDNKYITSSVTEVINLLALNQIGDRVVGNLDDNLISGGQRRRLSIGKILKPKD
jgi:ABC-type multidrug transport system, ATPase component